VAVNTEILTKPKARDWGLLATLVILWGSAYALTHIGVEVFPPAILVGLRLMVGAAVLGLGVIGFKGRLPAFADRRTWAMLGLIGACGTLLPFLLISQAQKNVPSALAAIYIAAAPLTVAVLSHLFIPAERLDMRRASGVLVGFVGVCFLFAPALLAKGMGSASALDQGLLLIAAVLYGTTSFLVRITSPNVHPVVMAFCFVTLAALMSVPLMVLSWPETGFAGAQAPQARHWLAVAGLGIGATGLANLVYVLTIRRVGPVFMSNVGNLAPFWSLLLGVVFLGESLPPTAFVALALLLGGVWLSQRR
jgi:drug/metabolite transporter (DMT)-like permease